MTPAPWLRILLRRLLRERELLGEAESSPGHGSLMGQLPGHQLPGSILPVQWDFSVFRGKVWVKNPPASAGAQEIQVRSLGREDHPGEGNGNCSITRAWKIPWTGRDAESDTAE